MRTTSKTMLGAAVAALALACISTTSAAAVKLDEMQSYGMAVLICQGVDARGMPCVVKGNNINMTVKGAHIDALTAAVLVHMGPKLCAEFHQSLGDNFRLAKGWVINVLAEDGTLGVTCSLDDF